MISFIFTPHRCIMINRLLTFTLLNLLIFVTCSQIEQFQNDAYGYFSQFHIQTTERKLIVGARDYLLQFDFDDISKPTDAINLEPDKQTFNLCKVRGQTDEHCKNFILVLFTYQDHKISLQPKILNQTNSIFNDENVYLIACGTFAFMPKCTIHDLHNLKKINRTMQGSLICPYSHLHKFTLLHSEGDLYFGGPADLLEKNKLLVRNTLENDQKNFVQTFLDNSKMLYSDSKFIYSFETKDYVYFLFRETSVEDLICTSYVTSRIGRVCKNDPGTKSSMGRFWNTFIKAKISCSIPGGSKAINLDEIVDAYYLSAESKLFVVFKADFRSAVCTYDLNEIESKFINGFKHQTTAQTIWSRYDDRQAMKQYQCNLPDKRNLAEFLTLQQHQRKYQIAYQSIDTTLPNLLIQSFSSEYKEIQVDLIERIKPKQSSIYVVYLITSGNYLAKYLINLNQKDVCFLGQIKVLSENEQIVKFKLSTKMQTILIGSTKRFLKVQISNCKKYQTKSKCLVESQDPYCVWNSSLKKCEHIHELSDTRPDDLEQPNFSSLCQLIKPKKMIERMKCSIEDEINRNCLCRYDPSKSNPFEVSSCTIDGGWSEWGEWSECKDGKKMRTRQCNNPKPSNGKQCTGKSIEIEPCLFLYHTSAWTSCSTKCGFGYQTRQNLYLNDGVILNATELKECRGIDCERQECRCVECNDALNREINKCVGDECDFSKSIWSPCGSTCAVGFQFKQINKSTFLKRRCDTQKRCLNWSEWSEWSKCSENDHKKEKVRYCYGQECAGEFKTAIVCDPKNDSTINHEMIIIENDLNREYGIQMSKGTLITLLLLFFSLGLISGPALIYLYKNKDYFKKQRQKNLSLRSVSSPLIRADKNTYVTNLNKGSIGNGLNKNASSKDPSIQDLITKATNSETASRKGSELSSLNSFKKAPSILRSLSNLRSSKSPHNKEDRF